MITKKLGIAAGLLGMAVFLSAAALQAGPDGGKNGEGGGGGYGGGDGDGGQGGGKNGGGKNGGGGGGGGKNGGGITTSGGGSSDYRKFRRHHLVACQIGYEIIYALRCPNHRAERRVVFVDDPVILTRRKQLRRAKHAGHRVVVRQQRRQPVVVVQDGYGYGSGGMSTAARLQQEKRLRRHGQYGEGHYVEGDAYAEPRTVYRKKKRKLRLVYRPDYYADDQVVVHYGPAVSKQAVPY